MLQVPAMRHFLQVNLGLVAHVSLGSVFLRRLPFASRHASSSSAMAHTISRTNAFTPRGVEDYISQYPRPYRHITPDSPTLRPKEGENGSPSICAVQGPSTARVKNRSNVPGPLYRGPPGLRQDAIQRRSAWLQMKYRQRMKLQMKRKKIVSQQVGQLKLNKDEAHSSVPSIQVATAATIRLNPPPLLKLLDPQDRGIFTPRPLLTVTLRDYLGTTNLTLEIPSEGIQASELTYMVLQQQRCPHEALPTHRYYVLQVFTPHCVYSVAPDETVMPQPPLRAVTTHIDSTYLLTVDASHFKIEEDEKLAYCQELLPCSKELQESRYSEVLKGRRIALQARVTAREDMLRFVECVRGGKLQVEGCSVDEAVEVLVHHGFNSDPEEMVYRFGELNEFWKESYEDGYVGWHQQDCYPHQAPKLVREQGTQYITPSDMGPYGRHWYPDYSYLRQAIIAAKTKSQLVEQLTEELHSYRHSFHHLDSITPKELFADDRETLLECLYEEAQIEQLKEEQQALFQSQLEAKQYHVSSDHLAGVTILRQLPKNFNDFRFCLDIFTYVLSTHAYDLALKMAIKEFCDMRGYYLFRTFLLKMIKKNRREILEVLENSKKMSLSFSDKISPANPVIGGNLFDVSSWQSDDEVGPIPSKQPEVPATSRLPTDTSLHHKDKMYRNKGKRCVSQNKKKTSQQHVRSNVQHHRTSTMPRHHRSGPKSGHHRTGTKSRHHKTVTSSRHQRTSTISKHHTTVTSSKYRRTVISSKHYRTVISSRYHTTVTSSRYCKTVTSSRTSTTPRHHRPSDTKARGNRTDTTSRHQRTSTSSTHHRTHNVFRHHRTHTTSRKDRPPGTTARRHTTHTTATHHRTHTTARHQKTHTTARHHRTHTTSKRHTSPGNTTRHCKTHTTSRHHRPTGTTSRHHRTSTSSGQHPTSTIAHHMASTVPEHDIVLERDYKEYKTVHSEGSSGHKKHVFSQPYDNDNDSFFSDIHDDEIKQIFEGSSEDETAEPSGGEICLNKDRGSHAAETDKSECYSITSNDNSDSDQGTVHYGGDDSDVHSTSYDSNKMKKAMILSTSGRVPNSFYEFGDSSSDIISYDTSSDDEDSGSGVSDEKEEPHIALNNGTDSDAMTFAGYTKQSPNNAETVDHHKKKADGAEKKKKDNKKMHEKEESLWEPVALTKPEGHLTSWGPLKLIYDNLSSLLKKWDHYRYLVRVFHRAFKLECEKWREVVKRTYRLLTPKFREMERRRETKNKDCWYKLSTPRMNIREKYQGRKSPCGTELRWVQNHVHWLMKYDMTLNLKHHALVRFLLKKKAGQAK